MVVAVAWWLSVVPVMVAGCAWWQLWVVDCEWQFQAPIVDCEWLWSERNQWRQGEIFGKLERNRWRKGELSGKQNAVFLILVKRRVLNFGIWPGGNIIFGKKKERKIKAGQATGNFFFIFEKRHWELNLNTCTPILKVGRVIKAQLPK